MVVYFHRTLHDRGLWIHVILGATGALGNLTDRLRLGWVTDFVSIGFAEMRSRPSTSPTRRSLGIGALVIYLTFLERRGRRDAVTARSRTDGRGDRPARTHRPCRGVGGRISRAPPSGSAETGARVEGRRRRASDRLAGGEKVTVELSAPPDTSLERSRSRSPSLTRTTGCSSSTNRRGSSSILPPGMAVEHWSTRCSAERATAASRSARSPASGGPGSFIGSTRRRAGSWPGQDRCRPGEPHAAVRRAQHRRVPGPRSR